MEDINSTNAVNPTDGYNASRTSRSEEIEEIEKEEEEEEELDDEIKSKAILDHIAKAKEESQPDTNSRLRRHAKTHNQKI